MQNIISLLTNELIIPEIQRDYVWGDNELVLKRFLNNIKNKNNLDIGFFYSYKIYDESFALIDGQQRITTLVLLYWYLEKEQKILQKFKFKVRENCNNFLEKLLLSSSTNIKNIEGNTFSQKIKNSTWYLNIWDNDPTVSSILKALDIIDTIMNDVKENDMNISFTCISHNDRSIEKEYILLNNRGVKLTLEEQLKAILTENISDKYQWLEKWEKSWQDILWDCRDQNIYNTDEIWNTVLYWVRDLFVIDNKIYKNEKKDFDFDLISIDTEQSIKILKYLDWIIPTLQFIKNNINKIKEYFESSKFDALKIFTGCKNYSLSFRDRALTYCILYLFKNRTEQISDLDLEKIKIYRNLIFNSDININNILNVITSLTKDDMIKSNSIEDLIDVLSDKLTGINLEQVNEEKLKLQILKEYPNYREIILKIEKSTLFDGKIRNIFILILSNEEIYNSIENIKKLYNAKTIFTDDNNYLILRAFSQNIDINNLFLKYQEIDIKKRKIWGELLLEDSVYKQNYNENNDYSSIFIYNTDNTCAILILTYLYKTYKCMDTFLTENTKIKLNKLISDTNLEEISNPIIQLYIIYKLSYNNGYYIFENINNNNNIGFYQNEEERKNDNSSKDIYLESPFNKKYVFQSYRYQWRGGQPFIYFAHIGNLKDIEKYLY